MLPSLRVRLELQAEDGTIFHRHNSGSRDAHVVHFTSAFYTLHH